MSPRHLALAGALLIPFAVPAAAQAAPTISSLKPCYVTTGTAASPVGEFVDFTASGFTPNSLVDLAIDDVPVDGATGLQTDPTGSITLAQSIVAPFIAFGTREFSVTLTEQGNPANTVTATARTSALGVSLSPSSAPVSSKIRFKGLGFTENKPVWAHYIYKRKLRKTVKMTGDPGLCGKFRARRRQIPVRNPGTGRWVVQFDQSHSLRPLDQLFVYVQLTIRVSRG
jgi:hypothetical protein